MLCFAAFCFAVVWGAQGSCFAIFQTCPVQDEEEPPVKKAKSASNTDQVQGEEEPPNKKAKSASSTDQVQTTHSSYSAIVLLPDGSIPKLELTAGPGLNATILLPTGGALNTKVPNVCLPSTRFLDLVGGSQHSEPNPK
eukprot:2230806-Amphidinium_carterae.1